MKERVRELWDLCFNDDEAFSDLYFSMRYNDDINIVIEKEDKIVSALQMLPYPMTYHERVISTSYISGACTHPDYRKNGVMKQLLKAAFSRMFENNIYLTTLIPANEPLFNYYSHVGYSPVFDFTEEIIKTDISTKNHSLTVRIVEDFDEELTTFFNERMSNRNCCIQHSQEDLKVILEATRLEKGSIYSFWIANQIVGISFVSNNTKRTNILELLTLNDEVRATIVNEIAIITKSDEISILSLPTSGEKQHLGMARLINAEKWLSLYAEQYPEIDLCLELIDDMIEANNAIFYINEGKLTRDVKSNKCVKVSVQQLTQALMGYNLYNLPEELKQFTSQTPYMSLMLN